MNSFKNSLLLLLITLVYLPINSFSQGDLLMFPKRVVFEGGKRSEVINLTNIGRDTAVYGISFVQIRLTEDGNFENITEPDSGQLFADQYIRFYPRIVTLAPNESQVVKLQTNRINTLSPGEYRSHLYFRAEPLARTQNEPEKKTNEDTNVFEIKIIPVYGYSIPCIIRVGESTTEISISNLSFQWIDSTPVAIMDFNRIGNMSSYGNITVDYISPEGKSYKVCEIKGFAVYTPGKRRRCKTNLERPLGVDYTKGKLVVNYLIQQASRNVVAATSEINLSK